jgi:hypothetical protein
VPERFDHSDVGLSELLEDLGQHLHEVPHQDVRARVRLRLDAQPARGPSSTGRRVWQSAPARIAFAVLLVVVVVSATLAVSPSARRAVADWFGVRGLLVEPSSTPLPTRLGGHLALGERVSLSAARRRIDFSLQLPRGDRFGGPDEVYLAHSPDGGRITLLYRARTGLPSAAQTGAGLLVTEFRGQLQTPGLRKVLRPGVRLEQVTVAGEAGYWFEGQLHELSLADAHGRFFADATRLAGNTLVWQHGVVTLRLEGQVPRDEAIRIAELFSSGSGSKPR